MDPELEKEIESLRQSKVKALQARYRELFGEDSPSSNRAHLFRRVAWRLQARGAGELSERAQQRAAELADDAELRRRAPRRFWDSLQQKASATHRDTRLPEAGSRLTRSYQQRTIEVTVLEPILNDDLGSDFGKFLYDSCVAMLAVAGGAIYISMSSSELHTLYKAFTDAGGHWSTYVIWVKDTFTLGRSPYQRQYEPILFGWKEGGAHYFSGQRNLADVWLIDKPRVNDLHPTMKPVELIEKAILHASKVGDLVLDPFAGSGSTVIACQKTSRCARMIELDPRYVDVAILRWQAFSGQQATLASTGQTFAEVTRERQRPVEEAAPMPE